MNPTVRGSDALNRYLSDEWTLDELYDWALTFGDRAKDRTDAQSMSIAGHVLAWVWEMNDGVRTQDEFHADLEMLARTPQVAIAHSS